jgi:hypothetical protein
VADPLPNFFLILFGALTPEGALGKYGFDEPAE